MRMKLTCFTFITSFIRSLHSSIPYFFTYSVLSVLVYSLTRVFLFARDFIESFACSWAVFFIKSSYVLLPFYCRAIAVPQLSSTTTRPLYPFNIHVRAYLKIVYLNNHAIFFYYFQKWTRELCGMDSDGDGLTNGQELGDPYCTWTPEAKNPDYKTGLSHPGWNSNYFNIFNHLTVVCQAN